MVLILHQHLQGQRRLRDIHQIFSKLLRILRMILRLALQRSQRSDTHDPIPFHDCLRMKFLIYHPLRLPQTFRRQRTRWSGHRPLHHLEPWRY